MPCQIIQDEEDNNSQCTARAYGDYDWEEEEGEDTGNEMWLNDIYDDQQQTVSLLDLVLLSNPHTDIHSVALVFLWSANIVGLQCKMQLVQETA